MDSGDSCRRREGTSRGSHGFLVGAEFWPPTLRPARVFRGGRKSVAAQEETPAASPLLEDLRRRLVRAFQRAVPRGRSRRSREAAAAREERSRARVESALAGLRAELVSALAVGSPAASRSFPGAHPRTWEAQGSFSQGEGEAGTLGELGIGYGSSPMVLVLLPPQQPPGGKGSCRTRGADWLLRAEYTSDTPKTPETTPPKLVQYFSTM